MPNTLQDDFVALHVHPAEDINGLARYLGPPTRVNVGTTADPTTGSAVYAVLPEMTDTFTLPTDALRYQVTMRFSGGFSHNTDGASVAVKLQQDGVDVPNTTRSQSVSGAGGQCTISQTATIEVAGGAAVTLRTVWANPSGVGTATALGVNRRLEIDIKPLTGT